MRCQNDETCSRKDREDIGAGRGRSPTQRRRPLTEGGPPRPSSVTIVALAQRAVTELLDRIEGLERRSPGGSGPLG